MDFISNQTTEFHISGTSNTDKHWNISPLRVIRPSDTNFLQIASKYLNILLCNLAMAYLHKSTMQLRLKLLNLLSFLCQKITESKRKLGTFFVIASEKTHELNRCAPLGIHLPLYVISAICLIPFRCVKSATSTHWELQVASGWRRVLCFFFHCIIISRALCAYGLGLNVKFRWTYHDNFTADAATFANIFIFCSSAVLGILFMHLCRADVCQLYNAVRLVSARISGKVDAMRNYE